MSDSTGSLYSNDAPDPEDPVYNEGAEAPVYTLVAMFRVSSTHPLLADGSDVPGFVQELEDTVNVIGDEGVSVRGWYDISGSQHDADLLVWIFGDAAEDLQWGLRALRRTALLAPLIRVAGGLGLVSGDPLPAFLTDDPAPQWVAVSQRGPLDLAIFEADELPDLASQLTGLAPAPRIGRYIEPVEIIEVLQ